MAKNVENLSKVELIARLTSLLQDAVLAIDSKQSNEDIKDLVLSGLDVVQQLYKKM